MQHIEPIDFSIPDVEIDVDDEWPVAITLRKLKHHLDRKIEPLVLVFPETCPDAFRMDYEVLLDNQPEKDVQSFNMVTVATPLDLSAWAIANQLTEDEGDDDSSSEG